MATKIVTKNGSGAPLASDLVQGELAVDLTNKRLYTEDSGGNVIEVGVNPAGEIQANAGIALPDNQKATFGAGDDLQIYHNGSNSFISDVGTGDLYITTNGSKIDVTTNGLTEYGLRILQDSYVSLYHDNAVKLATTNTGIDVTGDVSIGDGSASATRLLMGTGDDSKMFHNGTDTYWINDTGNIIIRNQSDDKDILLQTDDGAGGTTTYITVDGSETDVSLHYGGSEKLTTTSTGIDVTGTVVADGLNIGTPNDLNSAQVSVAAADNAFIEVESKTTQLTAGFMWTNSGTRKWTLEKTGTNHDLFLQNSADTTSVQFHQNNDISFYNSTGTTAKFFWDASAESLGIGTITPDAPLDVVAPLTNSVYASFSSTDTRPLQLSSFDTTSVDAGHDFNATSGNGALSFSIGGTERARIDSSGNLLVGTTTVNASGSNVAGVTAQADGRLDVSSTVEPLDVNRISTDGTIVNLRKNGTTVGSIGVVTSNLGITNSAGVFIAASGTQEVGIRCNPSSTVPAIIPVNMSNSVLNGTVDLGYSSGRFKDLYLSGGVYLGGTGAANHLDDYEEGTWTPALTANTAFTSVNHTQQDGSYVKIGNMVYVEFILTINSFSGGSSFLVIDNLPFNTNGTGNSTRGAASVSYITYGSTWGDIVVAPRSNVDQLVFVVSRTNATGEYNPTPSDISQNFSVKGSICYTTA